MNIIILTAMNVSIDSDNYTKKLTSSGGWIGVLVEHILRSGRGDRVDIISVSSSNNNTRDSLGNVTCHHLKGTNVSSKPQKELIKKFQEIIDEVNPDLIDIQGVEFTIGRDLLTCKYDCAVVATLQGLPSEAVDVHGIGMPKHYKLKRTLYDWTHFRGMFEKELFMKMRGEISYEILKKADYIIGRTEWDHAVAWKVNRKAKYYYNARVLRDEFYENKWDIKNIVPHTIFGIQSRYSIKGFHIALEALALLKEEYPDVKLVIPGGCTYNSPKGKMDGYESYIRSLIKKYSLKDNVEFTGPLTASELVERMKKAHVFSQYSLLETSPNSLAEAMVMGMPCVASYTSGTATYITPEINALAYERSEAFALAYMIKRIFDNDELAVSLSDNAVRDASVRFNREVNVGSLFEIYDEIYQNSRG